MKEKLNLQKLKHFKFIGLLKFLPIVTIVILVASFSLTIGFLYKYFYETIAQVKVVSILKNQVALNQVNVPLYEKVLNAWDAKKQFNPSALDNIRDPFQPLQAAATPSQEPTIEDVNSTE